MKHCALGKGEVESSILSHSTIIHLKNKAICAFGANSYCAERHMNMRCCVASFWQGRIYNGT